MRWRVPSGFSGKGVNSQVGLIVLALLAGLLVPLGAVAYLAESASHHPDITIQWNKVTLTLSTHSAGGLTDKDFALARQISALS